MGELVPIAGMLTGLIVTVAAIWGAVKVAHGPLGQAVARRLQGHSTGDAEVVGEVAELREQLEVLRHQLEEAQERIDFAERLLSQRPQATQISTAKEGG